MFLRSSRLFQAIFLTIFAILVSMSLMSAPATGDMQSWVRWAVDADKLGVVPEFRDVSNIPYPPYSLVILLGAFRFLGLFGVDTFDAIKLCIFLFLLLTSLVFWLWTRDYKLTILLYFSLILNGVALGYIDIFFAPSILLSFWALKERKWVLFSIPYTIACLTKWQPIIIAPFIALYVLDVKHIKDWKQIDFKQLALQVIIPAAVILISTLAIFGVVPVLLSFRAATNENYLSGYALNFGWILTHWLHVFYPDQFGGLVQGQAKYIRTFLPQIRIGPQLLFLLFYLGAFITFLRRNRTFEELVYFSLLGYLAYFTFNTGVHENHLFVAMILSILLFWLNNDHLLVMIVLILMTNINLLLFYGISGKGLGFSRVILNFVDSALLFSIFNVCFFLALWIKNVVLNNPTNVASTQVASSPSLNRSESA